MNEEIKKEIEKETEKFMQKFAELGIYIDEEQEPIDDFLSRESFWDADGDEWDLRRWMRVNIGSLISTTRREAYLLGARDMRTYVSSITLSSLNNDDSVLKEMVLVLNRIDKKAQQFIDSLTKGEHDTTINRAK